MNSLLYDNILPTVAMPEEVVRNLPRRLGGVDVRDLLLPEFFGLEGVSLDRCCKVQSAYPLTLPILHLEDTDDCDFLARV